MRLLAFAFRIVFVWTGPKTKVTFFGNRRSVKNNQRKLSLEGRRFNNDELLSSKKMYTSKLTGD